MYLGIFIVIGLSLSVSSDISISTWGLIAGLAASAFGGLRWVFVQLLLEKDEMSKVAIIAVYRFSFVSVISIAPLSLIFELRSILSSEFAHNSVDLFEIFQLLLGGGLIACLLIIVEINLINLSSSLTLSILGELKEIVQIILAMVAFKDHLTLTSGIGIFTTLSGAEAYRRIKHYEKEYSSFSKNNSLTKFTGSSAAFDDSYDNLIDENDIYHDQNPSQLHTNSNSKNVTINMYDSMNSDASTNNNYYTGKSFNDDGIVDNLNDADEIQMKPLQSYQK